MKIAERAVKVTQLMTKRGYPRFVKVDNLDKPNLRPLHVQSHQDLSLLSVMYANALIYRGKYFNNWQWFITTASHKLTVSTAYLSFTKDQHNDLKRLVKITDSLLPNNCWLLKGEEALLNKFCKQTEFKRLKCLPRNLNNSLQLGIAGESSKRTNNQKFSPVLRFFVHIMMICDENLEIG